jgi:hypothetical protein
MGQIDAAETISPAMWGVQAMGNEQSCYSTDVWEGGRWPRLDAYREESISYQISRLQFLLGQLMPSTLLSLHMRSFDTASHCVNYLFQTIKDGLIEIKGTSGRDRRLRCHVDASYLLHPESKSHARYCMSFGDIESFYSISCKQKLVTTNSTHAEMLAAFQLVQDIIFITGDHLSR